MCVSIYIYIHTYYHIITIGYNRWCNHLGAMCIALPKRTLQQPASDDGGGSSGDVPDDWHLQLLQATAGGE